MRYSQQRIFTLTADSHAQAQLIRQPLLLINIFRLRPPGAAVLALKIDSRWKGGVAIALLVLATWTASLAAAFIAGAAAMSLPIQIALVGWLTFLYTGLFVTGHDAMHGSIAPANSRLNSALGRLSLLLYGLIPYEKLRQAHTYHHQFPASHRDPDFHNGRDTHGVLWYVQFMRRYWTLRQWIGIVIIYNGLHRVIGVPEADLLLFWAIPSLLSSVQLFYFGTYLVHRRLPDTYSTPLCANSTYWPYLLSLITCYHFGYHREHHACPDVPWWQLPQISRQKRLPQEWPCHRVETDCLTDQLAAKYRPAASGSALATISRPFVKGDRTRLKT